MAKKADPLTWKQALKALKDGKRVTRPGLDDKAIAFVEQVSVKGKAAGAVEFQTIPGQRGPWKPGKADREATDWQVVGV